MNPTQIQKLKHFFKDKPVFRVYLFGSSVTGKSTNDSDIDILVELDHSQAIGLLFIKMKFEIEELLDNKVDLVTDTSLSKYIRPFVERERYLIYERKH
jgi:uncharacterized protein